MEIQGKIKLIGETKTFGANGFRKREFVMITNEKYPQHLPIELVQDKVEELGKFSVGDEVEVSVNVQGREWTNPEGEVKHFLSLQGWRMKHVNEGSQPIVEDDPDDLPF